MQHGGGGRGEHACNAQPDQRAVEADHKAVVAVDAAHQALRDAPQRDQFEQAVCRDSDVRDLAGNGRSVADGDADIRRGQGRRVVDAVADHDDRAPRCTLGFDKTRLVLRQYLGAVIVHTDLSRNGRCGACAVAGQHDRAFDA